MKVIDRQIGYERVTLAGKTRLHRFGIEKFLLEAAAELKAGALLLDGGAGNCKHKGFFPHAKVIALDLGQTKRRRYGQIDIAGNLFALPCRDNCFDAVISVEVMEHTWRSPRKRCGKCFAC
jgi:hypothetical protein